MTELDVRLPERLTTLDETGRALLFTAARTSNSFSNEPVSDDELTAIWELAKWPPSAANTQPLRVVFVRTDEGKARLLPHIGEGNRAKAATAPVIAILAADNEFHEYTATTFPIRPEMKDHFASDDDMRKGAAAFNSTLQIGYFLLAVRASGLVAGPMGGFDKDGVDAQFFADGRFKSLLVVNIGHPGENPWFPRLPRLDNDKVLTWA
jgi:3-hydroxypropanoate dehydrogenase